MSEASNEASSEASTREIFPEEYPEFEGWVDAAKYLPQENRAVAVVTDKYSVPLTGHMADGRWTIDSVFRGASYDNPGKVVYWHDLPNILEPAREAEWNGSWWIALQRQRLYPTKLVRGRLPEWITLEEIPAPLYGIGQIIRYRTSGGAYTTGTIRAIRYRLSERKVYRETLYLTGHGMGHLDEVPDDKYRDISTM